MGNYKLFLLKSWHRRQGVSHQWFKLIFLFSTINKRELTMGVVAARVRPILGMGVILGPTGVNNLYNFLSFGPATFEEKENLGIRRNCIGWNDVKRKYVYCIPKIQRRKLKWFTIKLIRRYNRIKGTSFYEIGLKKNYKELPSTLENKY